MASRNTYVPTHTRVKARRIKKLHKAIMTNPPDCDEGKIEMMDDLRWLEGKIDLDWVHSVGDNNSANWGGDVNKLQELEDKYIKAPKEALKGL